MNSKAGNLSPGSIRNVQQRRSLALVCFLLPLLAGAETPAWISDVEAEERERITTPASGTQSVQAPIGEDRASRAGVVDTSGPFIEEFVFGSDERETVGDRERSAPLPKGPSSITLPEAAGGSRYEVQPSDVLVISVWKESDLLREVTVSPDGWITFPLVGELRVEGLTVSQIRTRIEERLRRYINRAAVDVTLKQTFGNRIYVIGKVNNPGVFPFSKQINVVQALSLAGGPARFAALESIQVLRGQGEEQLSFRFNFAQVERGRRLDQNITLRSGDVVIVP